MEMDDPKRRDWLTYKRLNRLQGAGLGLSSKANERLAELKVQNPEWSLDGSERDEFAIWSQVGTSQIPDTDEFSNLKVERILPAIRAKSARARFDDGDTWRAYTKAEPARAFDAIITNFRLGNVQNDQEWSQLFWSLREIKDNSPLQSEVANWLIHSDIGHLVSTLEAVANWLQGNAAAIASIDGNPQRVLQVWDRLAANIPATRSDPIDYHNDLMGAVLNSAAGVLVDVLFDLFTELRSDKNMTSSLLERLEGTIKWPGEHGVIAQACLLQRLPYLEAIEGKWTRSELAPFLNTRDEFWLGRWNARFYHDHPGTRDLFSLTKQSFLETFKHFNEITSKQIQVLLLVNSALTASKDPKWPLSPAEAKQALLQAGSHALVDVCYLLRNREPGSDAGAHWRKVVLPALKFVWPLDGSARTKGATESLLQLIFESGEAFEEASRELLGFLTPVWNSHAWNVDFLLEGETLDNAIQYAPQLLEILSAIVDRADPPARLNQVLDKIAEADEDIARSSPYGRLKGYARKAAS